MLKKGYQKGGSMINTEMGCYSTKAASDLFEGSTKETDKIFYQFGLFISYHFYSSSHILGIDI